MANSITDRIARVCLLRHKLPILLAMIGSAAAAQTPSPAPSEAVQRQALGPYRMILRSAAIASKPKAAPAVIVPAAAVRTPVAAPALVAPEIAPDVITDVTTLVEPPELRQPTPTAAVTIPAPVPLPVPLPVPEPVAPKTALVLIKNEPPSFRGQLARDSPGNVVRVSFNVNPDGSTGDIKIAASSNRRLNSSVVAAVSQWRYQPIDSVRPTELELVFAAD